MNRTATTRTRLLRLGIPTTLAVAACGGDARPADTAAAAPAATPAADSAAAPPAAPAAAAGAPKIDPANVASALEWDAAAKTMKLPMVSGVGNAAGGWNFDGHAKGSMTIVVPVGTTVEMPYYNDDIVPHSMGVVAGTPSNVPSTPADPVFPNAITVSFQQGLMTNKSDMVRFTASKPGRYLIVCGVPGHAASGMWVVFEVSSSAKAPSIKTS